ncbi:MAG: alanine--glyoxylate aminotransferase family protein [candidate division WOR-3 bacterium]
MIRPKYKLWTPGPVDVPDSILRALSSKLVYHREEAFAQIYRSVQSGLAKLLLTKGRVFVLTASGTGGMEAAVANLVSPNDKVVVAVAGKFGERWRELCIRFGGFVDELTRPYGDSIPPEELERKLRSNDSARCVFTTLTETSTGALNNIRAFGDVCHRLNRLLIVDAVAGFVADELRMDAWNVDVVVAGSQKGLALPPGLAFIALNERAWEQVERCKGVRYYFDLRQFQKFAENGQTPWTPAISLFYALDMALKALNRKGIVRYWKERAAVAEFVRNRITEMGLELFPRYPSNALTVVKMPQDVDGTKVVDICKRRHGILFANGQAEMKGKIVRIGHMGPVTRSETERSLKVFARAFHQVAGRVS